MSSGSRRAQVQADHTRLVPAPLLSSPVSVVDGVSAAGARLSAWLDRIGVRSPVQRDVAAAVAWSILSVIVLTLVLGALAASGQTSFQPQQGALIVGLGAVQCLLLAVRRTHPIVCLLAVSALQVVFAAALPENLVLFGPALVVAAYTVGTLLAPRLLVSVLALSLGMQVFGAIVVAFAGLSPDRGPLGFTAAVGAGIVATGSSALFVISAASIGAGVALSREQQRMISARAAAIVEHQALRTNAAVATERTRMARELHDIAAHHLSALIVQAAAAERLVDTEPAHAKQIIREVRAQGRETLADMRSIVGILRDTGGAVPRGDGDTPIPGLDQLEALIDAARASGDTILWRVSGPTINLPPLADITTYRIAQEALANARRHAPTAPVTVVLMTTPTRLVLEIENALTLEGIMGQGVDSDLSPAGPSATEAGLPGHGVLGMRERAALVGARLAVGPTNDNAWRVVLDLPIDTVDPPTEESSDSTRDGDES